MRTTAVVIALVLSVSGRAAAQEEWAEYVNTQDGFKVDLPGQPKVTETIWKSQMDYILPAKSIKGGRKKWRPLLNNTCKSVVFTGNFRFI